MEKIRKTIIILTSLGDFEAVFSKQGLCNLRWPDRKNTVNEVSLPKNIARMAATLTRELNDYTEGKKIAFSVPLDFSEGTKFQQTVWKVLARVRWGGWISYSALARRIKHPTAARAVAAACGANHIPIVIPCHRVLRSDGSLGGWSGPAGWKDRLLAIEGIKAESAKR